MHPDLNFAGKGDMKKTNFAWAILIFALLTLALGVLLPQPSHADGNALKPEALKYEVDLSWPKPLPNQWVTGGIGGVCIDSKDHIFVLNRRDLTDNELDAGRQAPPVIEFDLEGNVINSWGDPEAVPDDLHGCTFDAQGNMWMIGALDGIIQEYTPAGKLLFQIGKKGVVDSTDGTLKGKALNSGHTALFKGSGVVIDPTNGDIYASDGESGGGNHRVVVFDKTGQYLRQWELQRSPDETGPPSPPIVHCVNMDKDGLVYVCDRRGHKLQVFNKMGVFQKDIPIKWEPVTPLSEAPTLSEGGPRHSGSLGSADVITFSRDKDQKYIYDLNEDVEQINILDRATGQVMAAFGRPGHQPGEFTWAHFIALDSKSNLYVGEAGWGKRLQKFRLAGNK